MSKNAKKGQKRKKGLGQNVEREKCQKGAQERKKCWEGRRQKTRRGQNVEQERKQIKKRGAHGKNSKKGEKNKKLSPSF